MGKDATVKDIAHIVGVSSATVSRVLNEKAGVDEKVRKKVQQAMDEIDFKPQRQHKKPRSKPWFAVLTENKINAFYSEVLNSIQEKAFDQGYMVFVLQMPDNPERQKEAFNQIKRGEWAGVISAGFYMHPEAWIALHNETGLPIVLMNTPIEEPGLAFLKVNFEGAIMTAIQRLFDLGHRKICYIGDSSNEFSQAEYRGVEAALNARGLTYPDDYKITVSLTPEGATQSISRIIMLPEEDRPTAIIAFDDDFAIQLLNALRYFKLRVPEDISLIGFDNIPMAARTYPALSTIEVPKYRIGQQLIELILQLIRQGSNARIGHIIIDGSLVVRESTGLAKLLGTN